MTDAKGGDHSKVIVPLREKPKCKLAEIDRYTTMHGHTVINYRGDDGGDYHEFITETRTVWLTTTHSPPL